jgi:oxygen-independent coproporphyrinogen-3 oxidase
MTGSEIDSYVDTRAAYVHIPFCSVVCPYCDFAVVAGADDLADRYTAAVATEIMMTPAIGPLDAIYFGGGTPSHVDPRLLARIMDCLRAKHGISNSAEVSIEANPEDFSEDLAGALGSIGFNRVSFGAQSFDPTVLAALGRRHTGLDIAQAFAAARAAGIENVSLDLIFGSPEESADSWRESLLQAMALRPHHVSCYALTVEPGTALSRSIRLGAAAPDPDTQADRYEYAELALAGAGYERYEVSNWAVAGRACVYNLTVWAQGEYEAYGNGAHRYRDGARSRNIRRLAAYVERVEAGVRPLAGSDPVTGWEREIDRLFVGLRRVGGVADGPGVRALVAAESGVRLMSAGVMNFRGRRLVVTKPLLTDAVHRAVLDLDEPEDWGKAPFGR